MGAKFAGSVAPGWASGERSWGARVLDMRSVFDL